METRPLRTMRCPDCDEYHPSSTRVCPDYREDYEDDEPTSDEIDGWIEYVYGSK